MGSVDEKKRNMPGTTLKPNKKEFSASHSPQTLEASSSILHYPLPNYLIGIFPGLIDRGLEVGGWEGRRRGKSLSFLASLVGPCENTIHQVAQSYSSIGTLLESIMD